ncbi:GAF domain-containing protein [Poseidonocella sp. HB161398]|uniref:helix-turn-helix domain-containing protein n=1 Tax=Poseidonocella sp. HB161398 TaxID=2320855 RepID=UPI001107DA6A|nr:GAF domain-containing protein [Poseidonocella sp. HB161398]
MHQAHADRVLASVTSGQAAARSKIAASWQRCHDRHRLDPAAACPPARLERRRLAERREAEGRLLHLAQPRLGELHRMIGHSGRAIFLTDRDGLVLQEVLRPADTDAFERAGLREGADWSEAAQGTNGIGTCLAERRALIIHRDQHYLPRNTSMSCIDAPIFGAAGELLGALDISSARADESDSFNPLIAAMAAQIAAQIGSDLFRDRFAGHRILLAGDGADSAALLAVDRDDIVTGATRAARRLLAMAEDGTLAPRPLRDLTGEASEGLDGAERAAVIRALTRAQGNVSRAARDLGLGRATLYRRMKRLGIGETGPRVFHA